MRIRHPQLVIATAVALATVAASAPAKGAAFTWVGGGANNRFGTPANWSSNTFVPPAGSDLIFGLSPAGNYVVFNDLSTTAFNTLTLTRASASQQVTIQNGYTGTALQVVTGRAVLDGGTYNLSGDGASLATMSLLAGNGIGSNGTIVLQNGAVANIGDALAGAGGAIGAITVTGTGTRLRPRVPGVTDTWFGGQSGTNTILVEDNAVVEAFLALSGTTGSFAVRTNGAVLLSPASSTTMDPIVAFGASANASVIAEVSSGGRIVANGESEAQIGQGAGANTTLNILSGGLFETDVFLSGAFNGTDTAPAAPATSTTTVNVNGAGSILRSRSSFGLNGNPVYFDVNLGTGNLNVTGGGLLTSPDVAFTGADRPVGGTIASVATVLVSGDGSTILARKADGLGIVRAGYGARTTANVTVSNNGLIDTDRFIAGRGDAGVSNVTVSSGGRILANFIETGFSTSATGGSTGNITVNTGGVVTSTDNFLTSPGTAGRSTILVTGGGSELDVAGHFLTGGFGPSTIGSGRTLLTVEAGGRATFGAITAGGAIDLNNAVDTVGTTLTVSGAGSLIEVVGRDDAVGAFGADVILADGFATRASLGVMNGGFFDIAAGSASSVRDGRLIVADATNAVASVTVDGAASTLNAGGELRLAEAQPSNPFQNASAIVNVRNGGLLNVLAGDSYDGDVRIAPYAGSGIVATLNIGGGTNATTDPESAVVVDGTVFVGGRDFATAGAPSTVNVNAGLLAATSVQVYAGSSVNLNRGQIQSDLVAARGGIVRLSTTGAPGAALMIADEYQASNNGQIDIGRGGGIARSNAGAGDADDIAQIRALILSGYAGGAWTGLNSIRSSNLSLQTPTLAIGYADIVAAGIRSFLGVTFDPADEAVVFRTTLRGDANVDGIVGFDDLLVIAQNYNSVGGRHWFNGDFDYNGSVTFEDLLALSQNYGGSVLMGGALRMDDATAASFAADWALAQSMVPEPTTALSVVVVGVLLRRRRLSDRR